MSSSNRPNFSTLALGLLFSHVVNPGLNAEQQRRVAAALAQRVNAARQGDMQARAEICPVS